MGFFLEVLYVSDPFSGFIFLILVVMSVLSWGLIIATAIYFGRLAASDKEFLEKFEQSSPLDLYKSDTDEDEKISGVRAIFKEIYRQVLIIEKHVEGLNFIDPKMQTIRSNFNELIQRTLEKMKSRENSRRERYLSFFATVSNIAPFVGLLGTVMGIIDAFNAISKMGSADLGFVAPAISEALVATALGLFVAIPASVAYNYFRAKSHVFRIRFDHFTVDLLNRIQQQYFFVKSQNESLPQSENE